MLTLHKICVASFIYSQCHMRDLGSTSGSRRSYACNQRILRKLGVAFTRLHTDHDIYFILWNLLLRFFAYTIILSCHLLNFSWKWKVSSCYSVKFKWVILVFGALKFRKKKPFSFSSNGCCFAFIQIFLNSRCLLFDNKEMDCLKTVRAASFLLLKSERWSNYISEV